MNGTGMAERISRWSVFLLWGLLPFFFIPLAGVSIPQGKMLFTIMLVVIATVAWIASVFSAGTWRMPKSSLLLAVLLVPIAYIVSALATGASYQSFFGGVAMQDTVATVMIWYALFIACVNVFGTHVGRLLGGARLFFLGSAVVLLIQIFHLLVPSFTFNGVLVGQAASVVGSWHDFGIFLGLLLFLALACTQSPVGNGMWKFLLWGIAIASAALLVIVNMRDVMIGLATLSGGYAAYLWFAARDLDEESQRTFVRRAIMWIVIAVASVGLYFGGNVIHSALPTSLQITRIEVRPSWRGTFEVGAQVFTQPSSIFFGTGPNTFPREWSMHKPLSVNATQFWNVDFYAGIGFIPTSFVTIGLLGVLAWGGVCLALLISLWRIFWRRSEISPVHILRAGFAGGAVYLTIFHILYVPGPMLSALTFMLFGALVATEWIVGALESRTRSLSFSVWPGRVWVILLTLFGFAILLCGIQSSRILISDMLINRTVVNYSAHQDLKEASRTVTTALLVWPGNDRAHRAAVEVGILEFTQLAASGGTDEATLAQLRSTLETTVQHGLAAVQISDSDYQNWLSLARLYGELAGAGVGGAEERARSAYQETFEKNPTNPLPLIELAKMDILKKDDAAARAHLNTALQIKPDFASALFFLSQIDARAGNLTAATENAVKVVQLAPDDSLGWYNVGTILYATKDFTNAAAAFERAVGLQNDYSNALYLLSASYAALGRFEDAVTALKAVVTFNPNNQNLPPMVTALEEGTNPFQQ